MCSDQYSGKLQQKRHFWSRFGARFNPKGSFEQPSGCANYSGMRFILSTADASRALTIRKSEDACQRQPPCRFDLIVGIRLPMTQGPVAYLFIARAVTIRTLYRRANDNQGSILRPAAPMIQRACKRKSGRTDIRSEPGRRARVSAMSVAAAGHSRLSPPQALGPRSLRLFADAASRTHSLA